MKIIGLTGSVGMGKSTTAALFMRAGIPVFDADQCVHTLYAGNAVPAMGQAFPEAIENGFISREKLSNIILQQPDALHHIEEIIHPMVHDAREKFLQECNAQNHRFVVLDIPLLFEKRQHTLCDVICVVSASDSIQRSRVLARPKMTSEKLAVILAKQMPDHEKRKRGHYVILTTSFEKAERDVHNFLRAL